MFMLHDMMMSTFDLI